MYLTYIYIYFLPCRSVTLWQFISNWWISSNCMHKEQTFIWRVLASFSIYFFSTPIRKQEKRRTILNTFHLAGFKMRLCSLFMCSLCYFNIWLIYLLSLVYAMTTDSPIWSKARQIRVNSMDSVILSFHWQCIKFIASFSNFCHICTC